MLLATCVVALFCFIPASSLAPPNCGDLVRPLDHVDGHQLDGRWHLIAHSPVEPDNQSAYKLMDSLGMKFSNASDNHNTSNLLLERILGFLGTCDYESSNITLEGNILTSSNESATFFHTSCSDCLILHFTNGRAHGNLHLYSKRREVEKEVMDEFKTQAECVKNQPPVMMDSSKKLCPDQEPTLSEDEELKQNLRLLLRILDLVDEAPDA
ncbi:hypothetical protein KUCAC02_016095 [Xyrichtys novacula]|uniref:Apolipoprotein M n=1 Tax=Xyrichtys novacula TaxID=13765 RepID=A0AAV1EXS2_XYRNO|nr:hypothetical protein KUCAC02_016095 [Xyrichtys novacula]